MADKIESIVQRMIDAGESEDNIAAVIKQSKSSPENVVAEARKQGAAGNIDAANDAFFKIPAEERKKRGLYAGSGGADTTTGGLLTLGGAVAPLAAGAGMLRRAGTGAAIGGIEGFIRSGGSFTTALKDAAMGGLTGAGMPTLQKYLKGAVGDIAGEAGRAYEAGRRTAQAPSIFKVPQAGLGKMLTGDASGEAIKSIEDAALRNQLLHEMRAR